MIQKLFVPYPLALLAKEKEFDEQCLGFYKPIGYNEGAILKPIDTDFKSFRGLSEGLVPAPLYQQLIDWFREKHNLDISLQLSYPLAWGIYITNIKSRKNAMQSSGTIIDIHSL